MTAETAEKARSALLTVESLTVSYGGVQALQEVSFELQEQEILGLVGPNGAGKTTIFNCLSGLVPAAQGRCLFAGHQLRGEPLHRIAAYGMARTFQHGALFLGMTTRENISVGCHLMGRGTMLGDVMRLPSRRRTDVATVRRTNEILDRLDLQVYADRKVDSLPFAVRKRIELARALAAAPRLLLLDEPACGLNTEEVDALGALILDLRRKDQVSILLIEHHMGLVRQIADRIIALNFGRKIGEGNVDDVLNQADVLTAYLGEGDSAATP